MSVIAAAVRSFVKEEEGIAVTEYGLLVALIAVALVVVTRTFGSSISSWFSARTGSITSACAPGPRARTGRRAISSFAAHDDDAVMGGCIACALLNGS